MVSRQTGIPIAKACGLDAATRSYVARPAPEDGDATLNAAFRWRISGGPPQVNAAGSECFGRSDAGGGKF